jgi:hypothetical protein
MKAGEIEDKRAALVWETTDVHGTIVTAHDALDHGKPHARAFFWGLGCKKWIENVWQEFGWYPMASVSHGQAYIRTWYEGPITDRRRLGDVNLIETNL